MAEAERGHSAEVAALRSEVALLIAELPAAKAEWTASSAMPGSSGAADGAPRLGGTDDEDLLEHLLRPESPLQDWVAVDEIERLL